MSNRRDLILTGMKTRDAGEDKVDVTITTNSGDIHGILHPANSDSGVIWACGALGGLDGPSFGIFETLSEDLVGNDLTSLRLDYRFPGDLEPCIADVLAGVYALGTRGIEKVVLVGHSFGGAVVIQAGIMSNRVKAVAGLSSQTYGAQSVGQLAPKPLLLIHGERDRNLSVDCSRYIYQWAGEPKELLIYKNNGHFLRECHDELRNKLRRWLVSQLIDRENPTSDT